MNSASREDEVRTEIAEHGYPHVLAVHLHNELFSDRTGNRPLEEEVAQVLGCELDGSLADLHVIAHANDVRNAMAAITKDALVETFQAELETGLANAVKRHPFYGRMVDRMKHMVGEATKREMEKHRVDEMDGRGEMRITSIEQEACLDVGVVVNAYVGHVKYGLVPRPMPGGADVAKRAAAAMQQVREIRVYDGLELRRVARPEITAVSSPVDLGEKDLIHPSHKVSISYTGRLPYTSLMEVYETTKRRLGQNKNQFKV